MPEDKGSTALSGNINSRSQREEKILQFWKDNKIFEKSLKKPSPKGEFVFYEGPPTANGKPGIHHLESRAFKDAIPRYKTMRGFHVPRKAGWDTHGLPVEIESEKKLGLKSKKEIEQFGVEKFNEECRKSVLSYINEWSRFTERIGYWVNLDDAYFTYNNSYIESVWQVIASADKQKLLYKDYKVVPWCPRCGTALSSHELAQGYQDVKDLSLYVKFKMVGETHTFFLAWTTTPWTLPGNLALAVGPDIDYVKILKDNEFYILAESKLSLLEGKGTGEYEVIERKKGRDLVGLSYEPLYNFIKANDKSYKVYPADFVTTEDGTGIVHTAVMYGQEDFELGTKIGLPKQHLVTPDATFVKGTGWLEGRSVIDESLAVDILKDLQSRGLLFGKENHEHSYPFCWRCKTRLIYYARDSWYVRMSALRDKLLRENEKINWEPEYIKEGRFGEWLRDVKDWAISRERYWGTPLPVWENEYGEKIVVDSIETLKKYTKKSGNQYLVMRHGEGQHNIDGIVASHIDSPVHLTEKGRVEASKSAEKLLKQKIDFIYASPFLRTKETVEIVCKKLGISSEKIVFDERLKEIDAGSNEGKKFSFIEFFQNIQTFDEKIDSGESPKDVKKRVGEVLYEIDSKHKGQNILIVTHGIFFEVIDSILEGADDDWSLHHLKKILARVSTGEIRKYNLTPLPHNRNFELDLHKPFIDDVILERDGKIYRKTKEVMDVWLDSGSMPFAQDPDRILYPADFISEAIDQTRGWFYTLHAVGVLQGMGRAYKNVICLGHILDKEGKKMSKSVGNIVEPFGAIEKYGVDVLRLWMYSVNQPGEPKNFDERSVDEINKRIFNLLDNVYAFYELYRDRDLESDKYPLSENILDKWILEKLKILTTVMTEKIEDYKLLEPVRAFRDFVEDLSTWYLRRSRERLKLGEKSAKQTLYFVLRTLSKLIAPFAPFAAEELYQKLRGGDDLESVHLESWPEQKSPFSIISAIAPKHSSQNLLASMEEVRKIVSLGLEARSKANIKIRQPLSKLEVKNLKFTDEYIELVKEEINVKEVIENKNLETEVFLDTNITPELEEEGKVRDIIRSIQEMRKQKGMRPDEKLSVKAEDPEFYKKHQEAIEKATNSTIVTD